MAKQRKWNNQGGSDWGDKPRKPKKDLPNIPQFDQLPESDTVSFRILPAKKKSPDYRLFGDEIWTNWDLFDNLEIPEIGSYELEIPDIDEKIRNIPLTIPPTVPPDLIPIAVYPEYEFVLKYKSASSTLVVTILSGQAYASRNQINDPMLDFAIVVASSEPIAIGSNIGLVNVIGLANSAQDPAFSLYNWVRSNLEIATSNSGANEDFISLLPNNQAIALPPTSFYWQNQQYNLFYGSGTKPTQLCLHAVNTVLKYEPSNQNASYFWTVTATDDPLPLCVSLDQLPAVFISIAPGSPIEIDPRNPNGQFFTFNVSIDDPIDVDLPIWFGVGGTTNPNAFSLIGYGVDANNVPAFIIPANTQSINVEIYPFENLNQVNPSTIELYLVANPDLYEIGFGSQTVDLVPVILPIVSISLAPGSPSEIDPNNAGGQIFTFRISIDAVQGEDLFVRFQYQGTADTQLDYVSPTTTFTIDGFACYKIPTGDLFIDIPVYPNPQPNITGDETIILRILQNSSKYLVNVNSQTVFLTADIKPIIIKFIGTLSNTGSNAPSLFCTNLNRSSIQVSPLFTNDSLASILGAIDLISQPGIFQQLQSGAYPAFLARYNNSFTSLLRLLQIDPVKLRSICATFNCRYLLVALRGTPNNWSNINQSFGSTSAQNADPIIDESQIDLSEFSNPYFSGATNLLGWTENRWLCQTTALNNTKYDFFFCCIQIDMLNPADIKFLEPIYINNSIDNVINNQRPQIVNS